MGPEPVRRYVPGRGLRAAAVAWSAAMLGWIALEGNLALDVVLSGWAMALMAAWGVGWLSARRSLSTARGLAVSGAAGLLAGVGTALMTLFLMAFKTGLHGHGPEYTPEQIDWVWGQVGLWVVVGLLAGLGLGLLAAARRDSS